MADWHGLMPNQHNTCPTVVGDGGGSAFVPAGTPGSAMR
jgi:hypothetical protein